MIPLTSKRAAVVGDLPDVVRSAAALLKRQGVVVSTHTSREFGASVLETLGTVDLIVWCGSRGGDVAAGIADAAARGIPVLGERELAFQQSYCLHVAVTGACGKRTTAELIAHLLKSTGRRVAVAAWPDQPACGWVEQTRDLDFLVHAVEPDEIGYLKYFRPVVAVLLNAPESSETETGEGGVRLYSRLFAMQQPFDWAIVEARAMARMEAASMRLPGKGITFSSTGRQADLGFERGLLVSRLEGWSGPLWDMQQGFLRGAHFAEDMMASLAVGRVLRLSLEEMTAALADFVAPPGRFEWLGEVGGVGFVHDGKAHHQEALERALMGLAPIPPENPFIWLITGGDRVGGQVYDLGPVLSARVKHAFVLGEGAPILRAAWQLFTPCTAVTSLLDAGQRAVEQAAPGDVILYSPGCPSCGTTSESDARTDPFREVFRTRVQQWGGSEGLGVPTGVGMELSSAPRPFVGKPLSNHSQRPGNLRTADVPQLSRESSNSHRS